jgi:ribonuclease BN (tRNA processing enzyme)
LSTHHVDAGEVGRMAQAAGVARLVLTHFAVPPGPLRASETYLRDGVRQHYAGPIDLARDLASFDVGCG